MNLKSTIGIAILVLSSLLAFGQNKIVDKQNCRPGESVEYCTHHKKMNEILANPEFHKQYLKDQEELKLEVQNHQKSGATEKATVYKIPVVFHVLHNGGVENISREQILDQLAILNRDYRMLNSDINTVSAPFNTIVADIEIEFVLATIAPNGQCFSGITRTLSSLSYDGSSGAAQANAIKYGNDVAKQNWPTNQYLNIFVCGDLGNAAGYTYNPSGGSYDMAGYNSIWISHNYVGSIGTSSVYTSRALTHEVGHWLNLDHTWGGTNDPNVACGDDSVSDTPFTKGADLVCDVNSNTCNDLASGGTSSWTYDVIDNVENYMEYSYCSKMFTQGQKTRMRAVLTSAQNIAGRKNLVSTTNLNTVGANGLPTICKADFNANKMILCVGDSIIVTDATYNKVTSWSWTATGAVPSTSSLQNPVFKFNTPGTYSITLNASDGVTSKSLTKTNYITVLPSTSNVGLPYYENFETYTSLPTSNNWVTYNSSGNNTFDLYTGAGSSGLKCLKLGNFQEVGTNVDELYSYPLNLSGLTNTDIVTFTYRYSYRKVNAADNEALKFYVTQDCGSNWSMRKSVSGASLSNVTSASAWTPTQSSDWVTVHVTNIPSSYFVDGFRYKFRFEGNGGNNIYLDEFNLYKGAASSTPVVLGINDLATESVFNVYPNPADEELNVEFSVSTEQEIVVGISDVSGKIVKTNLIKAAVGSNLVVLPTEELKSGLYFLTIQNGNSTQTKQIVIK